MTTLTELAATTRAAILTLTEALEATGRLLFRSDLTEAEKHTRASEIARDIFGHGDEPNPFHHPLVRAALLASRGSVL